MFCLRAWSNHQRRNSVRDRAPRLLSRSAASSFESRTPTTTGRPPAVPLGLAICPVLPALVPALAEVRLAATTAFSAQQHPGPIGDEPGMRLVRHAPRRVGSLHPDHFRLHHLSAENTQHNATANTATAIQVTDTTRNPPVCSRIPPLPACGVLTGTHPHPNCKRLGEGDETNLERRVARHFVAPGGECKGRGGLSPLQPFGQGHSPL